MKLIDLLDQDNITVDAPFTSKKRLFELIASKLACHDDKQIMGIYNSLVKREKLGNTSLGNGIAFPHGKYFESDEIYVHLIRLKNEIDYEGVDEVPVRVIFTAIFPDSENNTQYQKMMNDAVSFFKQYRLYKSILKAKDKAEILDNIMEYFKLCNN